MSAYWQLCEFYSQCHQNLNPLSRKRPLMAESKKPIWKISTVKSNKVKFRPTAYAKFQKSKVPYSWWWFNFSERSVFPIFLWLDGQLFPRNHRIFKKYSWFQKIESYWSNCPHQRILHRNAFYQGELKVAVGFSTKSTEEISARDQTRIAGLASHGPLWFKNADLKHIFRQTTHFQSKTKHSDLVISTIMSNQTVRVASHR